MPGVLPYVIWSSVFGCHSNVGSSNIKKKKSVTTLMRALHLSLAFTASNHVTIDGTLDLSFNFSKVRTIILTSLRYG